MESILNLIANAEKFQLPLLVVLGFCGFVLMSRRMDRMEYSLNKQIDDLRHTDLAAIHKRIDGVESSLSKRIDDVESSLNKRIDGVEASIKELKSNDLAHLNNAIEALTFTLKKNGSITDEDKEFVDTRLATTPAL